MKPKFKAIYDDCINRMKGNYRGKSFYHLFSDDGVKSRSEGTELIIKYSNKIGGLQLTNAEMNRLQKIILKMSKDTDWTSDETNFLSGILELHADSHLWIND